MSSQVCCSCHEDPSFSICYCGCKCCSMWAGGNCMCGCDKCSGAMPSIVNPAACHCGCDCCKPSYPLDEENPSAWGYRPLSLSPQW
jgi:hypothetical protein